MSADLVGSLAVDIGSGWGPAVTIVGSNYDGGIVSDLNRSGVFRLNIAAGREHFERLIGYPPAEHAEHSEGIDYTTAIASCWQN